MKRFDYLKSDDGRVHVINAECTGSTLNAGIFCSVAMDENIFEQGHHVLALESSIL